MDHFGIGPAMQALLRVYLTGARGSGRTLSLIESVRDGDRIICCALGEQRELLKRLDQAGRVVTVIVVNPNNPDAVINLPTCAGRTLFEHTWVEVFYARALERAMRGIDELQKQASRASGLLGLEAIHPQPDFKFLHF